MSEISVFLWFYVHLCKGCSRKNPPCGRQFFFPRTVVYRKSLIPEVFNLHFSGGCGMLSITISEVLVHSVYEEIPETVHGAKNWKAGRSGSNFSSVVHRGGVGGLLEQL